MDTASGSLDERKGLSQALDELKAGETLVVFKIDRLSRSLGHLIKTINDLGKRGIGFKSLNDPIDTTTPAGKMILHIIGALAEFELELIRMRTRAGLEAARAKGRFGGRPRKFIDEKIATARRLLADPSMTASDVALGLNISRSTLYRHLAKEGQDHLPIADKCAK
jgi:DNA invertase Pin-like site-specific DNA recombinase